MASAPEKVAYLYQSTYHRPNSDEVWPGRRNEPIGVYAQSSGQSRPLAAFDFTPEPSVQEVEVLLSPNEVIQTDPMRLFRTRVNGSEEAYVNPLAQPDGMPGVAFQWLEVEGPLSDQNAAAGYRLMFGDLPMRRLEKGANGRRDSPDRRSAAFTRRAEAEAAAASARERRMSPSKWSAIIRVKTPSASSARSSREPTAGPSRKHTPNDSSNSSTSSSNSATASRKSLLSAYTAILCSPGFLYVQEAPGRLDDYALATRLSLFLWNSPPDDELRALAAQGRLSKPEVLKAQTDRLLNDPKSRRFIDAFTDYWLDLRKIDDSSPSTHPLQRLRTRRPAQARRRRRNASLRPGTVQPQPPGAHHRRFRLHVPQ